MSVEFQDEALRIVAGDSSGYGHVWMPDTTFKTQKVVPTFGNYATNLVNNYPYEAIGLQVLGGLITQFVHKQWPYVRFFVVQFNGSGPEHMPYCDIHLLLDDFNDSMEQTHQFDCLINKII